MSEFWYIASTGRCGTQFLARHLHDLSDRAFVIHERLGDDHAPRIVLRNRRERYAQLGKTPRLQRLYFQAETHLKKGIRHITCDWHAYAWIDYFAERFGEAFRFVHLVRNPYDVAASHATHHPMIPGRLHPSEAASRIFASDPRVKNRQFAARAQGFSTFERQLFHWLEVNSVIREQEKTAAYRGLFRFEDVMAKDRQALNDFLSLVLGTKVTAHKSEPFDRVHRASPWPLTFSVDAELRLAVDRMALQVGYTQAELDAASAPDRLHAIYTSKRFDLPCDTSIPVIERRRERR